MGDIKLRSYQQAAIDAIKDRPERVFLDFESRHALSFLNASPRHGKSKSVHISQYTEPGVHRIDVSTLLPKHTLMYYHVQSAIMCWQ